MLPVLEALDIAEQKKREVLLKRKPQELRSVLDRQSALSLQLDKLETRREWLLAQMSFSTARPKPAKVSDILAWEGISILARNTLQEKMKILSKQMSQLKTHSEANMTLVEDARNLYHDILSTAGKGDSATGAGGRPVFVNTSC